MRPTVEVAHEALIRTWPRLRQWVDANRDKLRARAAILQAKAEWEKNGRREDLLLPAGFQLERARLLLADPGDIAIDDIKEFIAESEAADARRRSEDEAREYQRQAAELKAAQCDGRSVAPRRPAHTGRAGRRFGACADRGWNGIYARFQTTEAVHQRAEAERQRTEAERQRTEAVRQTAVAQAERAEAARQNREGQKTESHFRAEQAKQAGADAVTAALLALEGLPDSTASDDAQRTRPFVNEAWNALYGARLEQRERAILGGHTSLVYSAVFAPDGGRILTASYDKTARLWDRDGKPLAILEGHTDSVNSAVFAPDGGRILTASDDKTARLWDRDGKPLATLQGHTELGLQRGVRARRRPHPDRLLRQDGAAVGPRRQAARHPRGPHGPGQQRGVRARRRPHPDRLRRQDGAAVGPRRQAARHPRGPHRPGHQRGVRARRRPHPDRLPRQDRAAVGPRRQAARHPRGPHESGQQRGVRARRRPHPDRLRRQDGAAVGPRRQAARHPRGPHRARSTARCSRPTAAAS